MPEGFFLFVGENKPDIMASLRNDCLANDISSMNQYDGLFTELCNWDCDIETIKAQAEEK